LYEKSLGEFTGLTSDDAGLLYGLGQKFNRVRIMYEGYPERYRALTSVGARKAYGAGASPEILDQRYGHFDYENLIGAAASLAYDHGAPFEEVALMYESSPKAFKIFVSERLAPLYDSGYTWDQVRDECAKFPEKFLVKRVILEAGLGKPALAKGGALGKSIKKVYLL